jgi:hypothetical protein
MSAAHPSAITMGQHNVAKGNSWMSYEFQHGLYDTKEAALRGIASAWLYAGLDWYDKETQRDLINKIEDSPASLAAECIEGWGLGELLAKWNADAAELADAMARVLESARAEAARSDEDDAE